MIVGSTPALQIHCFTVSSAAELLGIRLMAIRSFAPTDRKAARKSRCTEHAAPGTFSAALE